MTIKFERLVGSKDIPEVLWQSQKKVMRLPSSLAKVWKDLLEYAGAMEIVQRPRPSAGPIGGVDKKATNEHLAWGFQGSAARVQLAMLDPHSDMPHISDAFAKIFSGGKVALADLPCGSGAASLTILSVVAELRCKGVLPRNRLDVVIVGAEISKYARDYATVGLAYMASYLEEQSIYIDTQVVNWNVCDSLTNTDFIRDFTIRSQACGARMLMLANFSGFLQNSGNFKKAEPQINELFRYNRDSNSSVIWIEPQTNKAIAEANGIFSKVWAFLNKPLFGFAKRVSNDLENPYSKSDVRIKNLIDLDSEISVLLSVIRVDL